MTTGRERITTDGSGRDEHLHRKERNVTLYQDDDDGYLRWMQINRSGFVLALRTKRDGVLHSAACTHLDDDGGYIRTRKAKVCSSDSAELRGWAREAGVSVTTCSDC